MTGKPLAPPNVAAAQARGAIGAEHVQIIEKLAAQAHHYVVVYDKHHPERYLAPEDDDEPP